MGGGAEDMGGRGLVVHHVRRARSPAARAAWGG